MSTLSPVTLTAPLHRRRVGALQRLAAWLFAGLSLALLGACAAAPGMNLDTSDKEVRARADLFTIDLATVRTLRDEARERSSQTVALPPAFRTERGVFEYRVAPQDVLQVTVWNRPELTNPSNTSTELSGRVVGADGSMYYPYVGVFQAAGKTVQEIREIITQALLKVIKLPQVDVSVLQYRGQRVVVSGEVRNPGTVPVTDVPPDLTDVIARAGGATIEADLSGVTITRGADTLRVDMQALYYAGDLRGNIRLRHGDIVNVPERRAAKVFVTGEVITPKAVLMPRGPLTLADALAEAGGVNPLSANAGQIFVLRGDADSSAGGKPRIYHLNAATPDALLLADQFALAARDVVYVDAAPVVRWSRVVNNVLPSAAFLRDVRNDAVRALPR